MRNPSRLSSSLVLPCRLVLLAGVLGGLSLTGCGSKSDDKAAVTPQPGSATPPSQATGSTPAAGQPPLAHDTAQSEAIIKEAKEGKNE